MAGQNIELTAADGHCFSAYLSRPVGPPRGGLIVLQEIFGLTEQMMRCADRFAEAGFSTIMPAQFDRVEKGLVIDYADFQTGVKTAMAIAEKDLLADMEAARLAVVDAGATAAIGYCFGGTNAYLAASLLPICCAVSFYGGGISGLVGRMSPKVPVMYHFGGADSYIPASAIDVIRTGDPDGRFFSYEGAGHGFSCDDRDGYSEAAAVLAEERSLQFLAEHVDG